MPVVLCIDDDPVILELQKSILENNGFTVFVAADGPTGIALACQRAIDVVVLDFKMPGMDGDEVAEVLLKNRPNLPIVICTGFFDAVPDWLRWFAAAYLEKGDGPKVLLSAIQELIATRKAPAGSSERDPKTPKPLAA